MMPTNNPIIALNIADSSEKSRFERIGKLIVVVSLWIFFSANQFPHTTTIKEISFYLASLVFVSLVCTRKVTINRDSPLVYPALAFIVTVVIGSFGAINIENTLHDFYSHLVRYVILWVIMVNTLDKKRDVELLLTLVVAATTVFCLYSLIDQYLVKKLLLGTRLMSGSQEITTNLLGIHTILAVNLAVYKLKSLRNNPAKAGFAVAIIILLVASFATQARSTLLALVLTTLILFVSRRSWLQLAVILISIGLAAIYNPLGNRFSKDISSNIRVKHMALCFEVFKDYPLTGIGYGMQTFGEDLDLPAYSKRVEEKYSFKNFSPIILTDPHNLYSDIAVRTGIIGFVSFIVLIITTFRLLIKTILLREKYVSDLALATLASLSSFMFIGFFEPVFSHPFEAIFCFLMVFAQITYGKVCKSRSGKQLYHKID